MLLNQLLGIGLKWMSVDVIALVLNNRMCGLHVTFLVGEHTNSTARTHALVWPINSMNLIGTSVGIGIDETPTVNLAPVCGGSEKLRNDDELSGDVRPGTFARAGRDLVRLMHCSNLRASKCAMKVLKRKRVYEHERWLASAIEKARKIAVTIRLQANLVITTL